MKVKAALFILLTFISLNTMASGNKPGAGKIVVTVVDKSGEALAGVAVLIEGSEKELYTDFEGKVQIESSEALTATFNYILHDTKEALLNPGKNTTIVLSETN